MTTAIVIDNGLYTELALTLAREGWTVYYYTPWQRSYPLARDMAIGAGFETPEGVFRVNHPLELIGTKREPDIWIFPDLYHDDLQNYLRAQEFAVWGCGDGDRLERDRWFLYETLRKAGQNVPKCVEVQGVEELADELKFREENPAAWQRPIECYIKISTYRGEMETHHHKSWAKSRPWYDDLVQRLGPLGSGLEFIIQEPIESEIEIGWDGIFCAGQLSALAMLGAECKDKAYLGHVTYTDHLPALIIDPMFALDEFMKESGYCNFFSTELRITKDQRSFLTDATCRLPSPPFEGHLANIQNLSKVIEAGSEGLITHIAYRKPWVAQLILRSPWAVTHPLRVDVPDKLRESVKLYRLLRADGGLWVMPDETGMSEIGSAVGLGDTAEEAMEACRAAAKEVDAYQLEYSEEALNEAKETMDKVEELL